MIDDSRTLEVINDLHPRLARPALIADQVNNDLCGSGISGSGRHRQPDNHGHLIVDVLRVHAAAGNFIPCPAVRDRQRKINNLTKMIRTDVLLI